MPLGNSVRFKAWTAQSADPAVQWFVNDVQNGNATVGLIVDGVYTAPSSSGLTSVSIRAVLASGKSATTNVTLVPASTTAQLEYVERNPRALNAARSDSLEVLVSLTGYTSGITLELPSAVMPMQAWKTGLYRIKLPSSVTLNGYIAGDLHNFVGYIVLAGTSGRINFFVNVRDGTVPDAVVTPIAADAQRTDYILNLRTDVIAPGHKPQLLPRLYALRPDAFDFVTTVDAVSFVRNRSYAGLRNAVTGIGLATVNNAAQYGSPSRLLGTIEYPTDTFFDLGERNFPHEVGHRWINFLRVGPLTQAIPHWPASSLGRDVMGISLPGGVGGNFGLEIRGRPDGAVDVICSGETLEFSDLSLYLMGLIGPNEVQPHYVLNNQSASPPCNSVQPATRITVADIIAALGPRVPDHLNSPRSFSTATIVLSRDRLLNADEMAFFTHMAARGEARTQLQFTSGFARGLTKPFFLATGGRATMTTRMW